LFGLALDRAAGQHLRLLPTARQPSTGLRARRGGGLSRPVLSARLGTWGAGCRRVPHRTMISDFAAGRRWSGPGYGIASGRRRSTSSRRYQKAYTMATDSCWSLLAMSRRCVNRACAYPGERSVAVVESCRWWRIHQDCGDLRHSYFSPLVSDPDEIACAFQGRLRYLTRDYIGTDSVNCLRPLQSPGDDYAQR